MAWTHGKLCWDRSFYFILKIVSSSKQTHVWLYCAWHPWWWLCDWNHSSAGQKSSMHAWALSSGYYKTGVKALPSLNSHLESLGKTFASKIILVARIQFPVVEELRSLFTCWLKYKDHSEHLEAKCVPWHVAISIFKPTMGYYIFHVLQISDFLFCDELEKSLLLKTSLDHVRPFGSSP